MKEKYYGWILDEFIAPGTSLTQGDLIRFEQFDSPLRKAGIIVTADCDLSQRKHAGLVTLVPVVSVKILLENYLLPEDCEKKRDAIEKFAFSQFGTIFEQERDVRMAILREEIKSMDLNSENPEVVAALFVSEQLNFISIKKYKALMTAINIKIKKVESLGQQIRDRGDLLILPDVKELGIDGEIAWIRHIWQLPLASIAIRTSEVNSRQGEKIARLDSPFRYRLTQLMAQVFSDIGLPNIESFIEHRIQEAYDHA